MPVTPVSWNAVVVGDWNRAILTADGIRRRLFELPEGIPVELQLALDVPGRYRVGHDGIFVVPLEKQLQVQLESPDPDMLERACLLCQRALEKLPETPVAAAGVNIRYQMEEVPDPVLDLIHTRLEDALSDGGFQVSSVETALGVSVPPGIVNLKVAHRQGEGTMELNFHLDSTSPNELIKWLDRSREFVSLSDRLAKITGVADVRREINT